MHTQNDFNGLYEAYHQIYDLDEKYWIQKAIKHPGALHKELGVPEEKKIPKGKLRKAAKSKGKLGKRARLALTLGKLRKEDMDAFDYIQEYLIAEGYAETYENALVIMTHMSEEWKQAILEE